MLEFLKKDKFLGGLFPVLQEKVRGKFPNTFEEALTYAKEKDRKIRFQSQNVKGRHPQVPQLNLNTLPTLA